MGDDRKPEYDAKYEMAPQSEADPEKGEVKIADGTSDEKKSADVDNEWGGLNKAELLEVADTPFWNWTRNILLILFWIGWVAMLVAAIVIVVKVPRCPEVEWWEKSVFYRVVPQSFKDSPVHDGYGDFKGLTKKLDYIQGIGADVIVLSSIFEQSEQQQDLGQEIVNFTNVDKRLGTLKDFGSFMEKAEEKGLKVILEFVPNHSSKEHPWFLASRNRTGNYSDYYVWRDCEQTNLPNDWRNKDGEPAWTYDDVRGQCYYHYLSSDQPDLNYDNVNVKMAMQTAIKFWFDQKVDGFIFSDVDYIFESGDVTTALGNRRRRQTSSNDTTTPAAAAATDAGDMTTAPANSDNTPSSEPEPTSEPAPRSEPEPTGSSSSGSSFPQYSCVGDACSTMQSKLHDLLVSWREVFNDNSYLGKYRLLVTETELSPEDAVLQFGNGTREADLVINLGFAKSINSAPTADSIQSAVASWLAAMKDGFEKRWNTWTLGDESMSRIASRAGEKFARVLNFILLTLPGTPISYYGEELGTPDLMGVSGVDASHGPMYWANFTNGNFTAANATAWLPLPTDPDYSVEVQDKDKKSSLSVFKELASLHGEPSMTAGEYHLVSSSSSVYAYLRQFPDWPGYLVVTNFGSTSVKVDFEVKIGDDVITEGVFKLSSSGNMPEKKKGALADFTVDPATSILIEVKH